MLKTNELTFAPSIGGARTTTSTTLSQPNYRSHHQQRPTTHASAKTINSIATTATVTAANATIGNSGVTRATTATTNTSSSANKRLRQQQQPHRLVNGYSSSRVRQILLANHQSLRAAVETIYHNSRQIASNQPPLSSSETLNHYQHSPLVKQPFKQFNVEVSTAVANSRRAKDKSKTEENVQTTSSNSLNAQEQHTQKLPNIVGFIL